MKRMFSFLLAVLALLSTGAGVVSAQGTVPAGIHYQAVARNNVGKELVSENIDVRFSIRTSSPVGDIVYQEVFTSVTTSKYGVFSLIIGKGTRTGGSAGSFAEIDWSTANHYLQVEIKFDNLYMDMGTMQFMAVPYALYAGKSLEPGPAGPAGPKGDKGDPGDPSTDNQTLGVANIDGSDYLTISGGNSVKISTIEHDGDPLNELQDLRLTNDILTITQFSPATQINLAPYNQALNYNPSTYALGISGQAATIDLSGLKNDNDASPTNEIQTLTYNEATRALSISGTGGNTVTLGSDVAFRAKKIVSQTGLNPVTQYDFICNNSLDYNDGSGFNATTGKFTAPVAGIYTFTIGYTANGTGDGRELKIILNGSDYEKLSTGITANSSQTRSVTMKLSQGDIVHVAIVTGMSSETGTGSFSGYRVN